jgi:peroxiredoxin
MNLLPVVDCPDLARRRGLLAMLALPLTGTGLVACDSHGTAPDVAYTLLDGSTGRTAALRGQVVLVNFWATSCAPCIRAMPGLVTTYQQFAPRGLTTLAVAMQYDAPAAVSQFAQVRQLPFGVVIDNTGAVARAFGDVRITPTTFVIDKRGAIAWHSSGEPDTPRLHALLARLLVQA